MPAKPLDPEQVEDAKRLKAAFKLWQSARRAQGLPATQDEVAQELFGIGQSALSQYLNGTIPLNARMLVKFAAVLGVRAENISPGLVAQQAQLAAGLAIEPDTAPGKPQQQRAA